MKKLFASPKILLLVLQVMTKTKEKHQLLIEHGKQLSQYMFFCEQNTQNIARKLMKETYKKRDNEFFFNIKLWVCKNPQIVCG